MNNNLHDIYEHDGDKDTLLGLAEECSELSAAALKLVRAIEGKTPKPKDVCAQNFLEEFADVECMMVTIANAPWFSEDVVDEIYDTKIERWRKRLEQFDKTGSMAWAENNKQAVAELTQINASIEHEKKIMEEVLQ